MRIKWRLFGMAFGINYRRNGERKTFVGISSRFLTPNCLSLFGFVALNPNIPDKSC